MRRSTQRRRQNWRIWMWPLGFALALTVCSSITLPTWGEPKHGSDKVIHILLFGLLANLASQVAAVRRCRPFGIYTAVLLVSLFGMLDEFHQHFTPGRSMDVWDWTADTLGAIVATILYQHSSWYRRHFTNSLARATARFGGHVTTAPEEPAMAALDGDSADPGCSAGSTA